jgi:hypothetical protein
MRWRWLEGVKMLDGKVFCVRPDDILHDTIEGETVVIDLRSGTYFRFDGAATYAWSVLLGRVTEDELVNRLAVAYAGPREAIAEQVHGFLLALYRDGIIHRQDASAEAQVEAGPAVDRADAPRDAFAGLALDRFDHLRAMAGAGPATKLPFDGMTLNRFEDLDELLMIDPVHEVGDAGWPHRPDAD